MKIFAILDWLALPFWLLSFVSDISKLNEKHFCQSASVFKFLVFAFYLFSVILDTVYSQANYSDLVFAVCASLFSGLFLTCEISNNYSFFDEISKKSQWLTIAMWLLSTISFAVILSSQEIYQTEFFGGIRSTVLIAVAIFVLVVSQFCVQFEYFSSVGYEKKPNFAARLLEITGAGCWIIGFALQYDDGGSTVLTKSLPKAIITAMYSIVNLVFILKRNRTSQVIDEEIRIRKSFGSFDEEFYTERRLSIG